MEYINQKNTLYTKKINLVDNNSKIKTEKILYDAKIENELKFYFDSLWLRFSIKQSQNHLI